jgi:hypothetical protein
MYPNALSVVSSIFPHLSHLKILAILDICDVQTEKDIYGWVVHTIISGFNYYHKLIAVLQSQSGNKDYLQQPMDQLLGPFLIHNIKKLYCT